ncbi:MAG: hypothetical protein ACFCUR_16610 [Rhodomicrobiaceae bacterium]
MKRFFQILIGSILLGGATLPELAEAASPPPTETRQAFVAPALLRASEKCLRNPYCHKAVAERAKKLRDRLDKWISEFTLGALQQLHHLLGEAIGAKDNSEAIARLDRLEQLLEQNGLLSADVRQEIEELRSALRS